MRIMGLDLGTKNVGVALSDESGKLAQGREVIRRTSDKQVIARIREIADEFGVNQIIVGLPVNMNGTIGERGRASLEFVEKLKRLTGLAVKLWDERLSTREAENIMISASVTRKKRKRTVDRLAAQIILQGYLDSIGA